MPMAFVMGDRGGFYTFGTNSDGGRFRQESGEH